MSANDHPCRCEEGAYLGAQLVGTPIRCERCRGLVDGQADALLERLYAESRARLEAWAAANPHAFQRMRNPRTHTFRRMCSEPQGQT